MVEATSDLLRRISLRHDLVTRIINNHTKTPEGCWEYKGSKRASTNYGKVIVYCADMNPQKRTFAAHRLSYAYHTGIDPKEKEVMHSCDNPICINPAHLAAGTHADNMRDMVNKKRSTIGETNPNSKVTEQVVGDVVMRILAGDSNMVIAATLPISHAMISLIRHKKCWIHFLDSIGYDPAEHIKFKRRAA